MNLDAIRPIKFYLGRWDPANDGTSPGLSKIHAGFNTTINAGMN
jgi:hypothetical protein